MAVELATAYVSLVPSAKGIAASVQRELAGPTSAAAASAGTRASQSFADKFSKGLGSSLSKAGGAMKAAGDKMSIGLSLPLAFLGNKVTNFASDLNESINATNVVFGESAGIITKHAKTAADSMGLSERAFREATTPMGAMLQNLGLSQRDAAKWSVDLAGRASDMASVFNTDVSVALEAINAGLRGESDPLEQFGVGLNEAAVNAEAARLGLVGANGEVTAGAKAQARLSLIMSQTAKIEGDFARTSEEGANAQRRATARAEEAAAAFGQKLLPVKLKLIKAATSLLNWFSGLSKGTQDIALKAGIAAVALGPLLSITGRLAKGISSVVTQGAKFASWATSAEKGGGKVVRAFASTAAEAAKATARVIRAIAVQIAQWVVMGVQALLAAAKVAAAWLISLGPIGLVIAAVAGAAALIIANWDKIKRFVVAAATFVLNFLKRNWPLIISIILGPLGIVIATVIKNWDKIKAVFRAGVDFIISLWSRGWNAVRDFMVRTLAQIVSFITRWKTTIIGVFANALSWLVQAGRNIVSGLFSGIRAIWDREVAFWRNLGSTIKGFVAHCGTWLTEGGKNIIRGLYRGITNIWKTVVDWFRDVPGKIKRILGLKSPPKWAIDIGLFIMRGMMKGLGWGVGNVMDYLSSIAGRFTGALKDAWDTAFGAAKEFLFGDGGGFAGLAEPFASRLQALINASFGRISIGSGRRSRAQQARLYARWLAGVPGQARAAPPGHSKHERGLAADLRGDLALAHRLAPLYGLRFPVRGEAWHIELGPGHSYFERGAWKVPPGGGFTHAGEMVLPAHIAGAVRGALGGGAGANQVYIAPGAVVIGIPPGATFADAERLGGAAGRGFLGVLAQRRVLTDARIA